MDDESPPTLRLQAIMADAQAEAKSATPQLAEVAELLENQEYARALGAFEGLEERVHYVGTVLRRFARHLGLLR
jgi:hypothetical protein